jgi:SnoaL-like domain
VADNTTSELLELEKELRELRAQVDQLAARTAIYDAVHRYSRGLDRRDWELLASAYHHDARDQHGAFVGTVNEFVGWVSNVMAEWDYSLHILDLHNIEIEGDTAHSECYVLFTQRRRDGAGLDFGGGRYLDRLERRDGDWRIIARKLVIDWSARADALTFADVAHYQIGTLDRNDPSYRRPYVIPSS